jgi:hypothetical protein
MSFAKDTGVVAVIADDAGDTLPAWSFAAIVKVYVVFDASELPCVVACTPRNELVTDASLPPTVNVFEQLFAQRTYEMYAGDDAGSVEATQLRPMLFGYVGSRTAASPVGGVGAVVSASVATADCEVVDPPCDVAVTET